MQNKIHNDKVDTPFLKTLGGGQLPIPTNYKISVWGGGDQSPPIR